MAESSVIEDILESGLDRDPSFCELVEFFLLLREAPGGNITISKGFGDEKISIICQLKVTPELAQCLRGQKILQKNP